MVSHDTWEAELWNRSWLAQKTRRTQIHICLCHVLRKGRTGNLRLSLRNSNWACFPFKSLIFSWAPEMHHLYLARCFSKAFIRLTFVMTGRSQQEKYMTIKMCQKDNSGLQFWPQVGTHARWRARWTKPCDSLLLFLSLHLSLRLWVSLMLALPLLPPTSSPTHSVSVFLTVIHSITHISPSFLSIPPSPHHLQARVCVFKLDYDTEKNTFTLLPSIQECAYIWVYIT